MYIYIHTHMYMYVYIYISYIIYHIYIYIYHSYGMHSFHDEKAEVIGLVEAEDLKPNDLVGVNKVSENFAVGGVYGHEMIWFKHVQTNVYQKKRLLFRSKEDQPCNKHGGLRQDNLRGNQPICGRQQFA